MKIQILILLFCVNGSLTLQAQQNIVIQEDNRMQFVGKKVLFLEDKDNTLTLHNIRKPEIQQKFQPHTKDMFNSPPSASAFWFKFTIQNQTNKDLWLEVGNQNSIWYADFYTPDSSGHYPKAHLLGVFRPRQNKEFPANSYCVLLAERDDQVSKTYYLKVQGNFPLLLPFQVGTTKVLVKHLRAGDYATVGYVALIFSMLVYNFFLLYSTKDKIYLIYLLYLLGIMFLVPFGSGYPLLKATWFWKYYLVWSPVNLLFATLFASQYLELSKVSRGLYYWLWLLMVVMGGIIPAYCLVSPGMFTPLLNAQNALILVHNFSLLFSGIYVWYKGYKNAQFYVLAWVLVVGGAFIYVFMINGILPATPFTKNALYLGFGSETLLFALALGDRLNTLKKEKEEAQVKNLRLIEEQNEHLEERVLEKTKELHNTNEELVTSNEELRQTQEEIEAQRDQLGQVNTELRQTQFRIAKSIKSAKLIQYALQPTFHIFKQCFEEYFIINQPKDVVSGDFYWLDQVGDKTILMVGDCTGHGVPGAFMTMIGHNLLDKIIRQEQQTNPSTILNRLHTEVYRILQQKETGNVNGMDAVAVVLKSLKKGDGFEIEFAGAKNNLLYWDTTQQAICELKGTRKGIGGIQNETLCFSKQTIQLQKGSTLYLGSDGLEDQNNSARRKLGKKRLKALLEKVHSHSLENQKTTILETLRIHQEGTEQRDDILWLGLKL